MSWLDRINAAIVRRIRAREASEPEVTDEGVRLHDGSFLAFRALYRVIAFTQPALIGEFQSLGLDFGDGRVLVVNESQSVWDQIVRVLDAHPDRVLESKDWRLRLVAQPDTSDGIEILRRS